MSFRQKKQKQCMSDKRMTVTAKHNQVLDKFKQRHEKVLPQKEKQLATVQKKLSKLGLQMQKQNFSSFEHNMMYRLQKTETKLLAEIDEIKSKRTENKYHLKTAFIVSEYLKNLEQPTFSRKKKKTGQSKKGVLSFFASSKSKTPEPEKSTKPVATKTKKPVSSGENAIISKIEKGRKRGEILDIYMRCIDKDYVPEQKYSPKYRGCVNCAETFDIEYDYTLGTNVCGSCGKQLEHFFDPQFTSYKECQDIEISPEFPYKRINHFVEWLAQFQAKENTEIPEHVFLSLEKEFKKNRVYDYKNLTHKFVKDTLKKLGLNKYYEHIPYIIHCFNGLPPPVLSLEMEDTFRRMFLEIQAPFEKCRPPDRKNFLSYSYVFHKFAQLLELDDLLRCFPLLKSREKLYQQDKIWKGICNILLWQFIPSV